jgi:RNA polymerase sigma-70 factor, ECF subfamily
MADATNAEELLAQIASGDEEALCQLYDAFRPRLRNYLWRQLHGDANAVEEALQDVFVAVWRTAASYRGEARVATWLFQIARYRALRLRHNRHDADLDISLHSLDEAEGLAAVQGRVLDDSHEDRVLDRLALTQALDMLSPKHREALYLVSRQGFSLEETAAILDVPVGTIKSRMSYARKALLAALTGAPKEGGVA